jgi:acyl carrier protein
MDTPAGAVNNLEARLARCFSIVFPDLDATAIACATMDGVETWDSMATVTLINVVEEEFGIQIAPESIEELTSFHECLNYLRSI